VKTTQYTQIERKIAKSETGSIRDRWQYGLRLLHDPEAIAKAGGLKNGVAEQLIKIAEHHGLKLSDREIRWRMQCARTYPTEGQFGNAITEYGTWSALIQAGFPSYPLDPKDDKPADHRTPSERASDAARAMLDVVGAQGALFPLSRFEPADTTLKDLIGFKDEQDAITQSFIATGIRRAEYLDQLTKAVGNDLERTWLEAHQAAFGTDDVEDDNPPTVVHLPPAPTFDDEPELD
jgi:hypothetical protein